MFSVLCFFRPGCRGKCGDTLHGRVSKTGQCGGEVFADWNPESATAFDYRQDGGDPRAGLRAADVDPVGTAERHSPDILPMSVRN